jgi:hypothetical protein
MYPVKVNRRFGGIYPLHLQDRRVSQARNRHETGIKQSLLPPKRRLTFTELNGVLAQNIELCFLVCLVKCKSSLDGKISRGSVAVTVRH